MNDIYLDDSQLTSAIIATSARAELAELNMLLRATAANRAANPDSAGARGTLVLLGDRVGVYPVVRESEGRSEILTVFTSEVEADKLVELIELADGKDDFVYVGAEYEPLNDSEVVASLIAERGWDIDPDSAPLDLAELVHPDVLDVLAKEPA